MARGGLLRGGQARLHLVQRAGGQEKLPQFDKARVVEKVPGAGLPDRLQPRPEGAHRRGGRPVVFLVQIVEQRRRVPVDFPGQLRLQVEPRKIGAPFVPRRGLVVGLRVGGVRRAHADGPAPVTQRVHEAHVGRDDAIERDGDDAVVGHAAAVLGDHVVIGEVAPRIRIGRPVAVHLEESAGGRVASAQVPLAGGIVQRVPEAA